MKVVIDIDEKLFNAVIEKTQSGYFGSDVWIAVANGVPLPKGHGELISRQDAYLYGALYADTIIPADYGAYDNKENINEQTT